MTFMLRVSLPQACLDGKISHGMTTFYELFT
jgi:hypothetical protein